jgi:hypothetical protein
MAKSHFETLIEPEIAACASRALEFVTNDPGELMRKQAEIRGEAKGLKRALEMYRQAMRLDIDEAA